MFTTAVEGAYYNISTFKDTQSLYFDKVSDMRLIRDQWKMVIYYDVNPYWQGSQLLKQYIVHLENMCSIIQKQAHCNVILLQLRHGYSELLHYDQLLLGQPSGARTPRRRRRRGLINGIGNVAHALFGVLDDKFAEQYQKDIGLVKSDQKHLAKLLTNQTSLIEAQYHFLQRLETAVDQQHKSFNQHLLQIEKQNTILKEIGRQIEQIKSDEVEVDVTSFSSHDIHHYVVIYILVGVCGAAGAAFLWRRVRRRCQRQHPAAADRGCGPSAAPPPRPAARLSLSDITSACANESDSVNYSVPDLSARSKVSVPQSARINKASSPIIKFKFTADNNESS